MFSISKKKAVCVMLSLVLILSNFIGCASAEKQVAGVLNIKVNPEFNLYYDAEGNVIEVENNNEDAASILDQLKDYEGYNLWIITEKLIVIIGEAGFLDGVDGEPVPITVTFAPAEGHEEGWEPPTELADDVLDVITACAEENEWLTNIIVKAAEEVIAEGTTVKEESSEPETSEPEVSDETSEEESSKEEESKPEESSKPVEQSKPTPEKKPEPSKPQPKPEKDPEPSKPTPQPEQSEDDEEGGGLIQLTPEQKNNCEVCGKQMGDGTNGTCQRWMKKKTCPNCGTEVPAKECHTCP